jgi:hypothetical protein
MSKELTIIDDSSRRYSAEQESPEVAVPSRGQLKIQQIHHAGFMARIQFVSQYISLNAEKLTSLPKEEGLFFLLIYFSFINFIYFRSFR